MISLREFVKVMECMKNKPVCISLIGAISGLMQFNCLEFYETSKTVHDVSKCFVVGDAYDETNDWVIDKGEIKSICSRTLIEGKTELLLELHNGLSMMIYPV